jgi:hypothetical protein
MHTDQGNSYCRMSMIGAEIGRSRRNWISEISPPAPRGLEVPCLNSQEMDAFMKFGMEPDIMAMWQFNKDRTFPVLDHQTTLAMVKK